MMRTVAGYLLRCIPGETEEHILLFNLKNKTKAANLDVRVYKGWVKSENKNVKIETMCNFNSI